MKIPSLMSGDAGLSSGGAFPVSRGDFLAELERAGDDAAPRASKRRQDPDGTELAGLLPMSMRPEAARLPDAAERVLRQTDRRVSDARDEGPRDAREVGERGEAETAERAEARDVRDADAPDASATEAEGAAPAATAESGEETGTAQGVKIASQGGPSAGDAETSAGGHEAGGDLMVQLAAAKAGAAAADAPEEKLDPAALMRTVAAVGGAEGAGGEGQAPIAVEVKATEARGAAPAAAARDAARPDALAAAEEAAEILNTRGWQGTARADLVVGDGDERVRLSILASEHHVRVSAHAAGEEMAQAMRAGTDELRDALRRQGLDLTRVVIEGGGVEARTTAGEQQGSGTREGAERGHGFHVEQNTSAGRSSRTIEDAAPRGGIRVIA